MKHLSPGIVHDANVALVVVVRTYEQLSGLTLEAENVFATIVEYTDVAILAVCIQIEFASSNLERGRSTVEPKNVLPCLIPDTNVALITFSAHVQVGVFAVEMDDLAATVVPNANVSILAIRSAHDKPGTVTVDAAGLSPVLVKNMDVAVIILGAYEQLSSVTLEVKSLPPRFVSNEKRRGSTVKVEEGSPLVVSNQNAPAVLGRTDIQGGNLAVEAEHLGPRRVSDRHESRVLLSTDSQTGIGTAKVEDLTASAISDHDASRIRRRCRKPRRPADVQCPGAHVEFEDLLKIVISDNDVPGVAVKCDPVETIGRFNSYFSY